jgi:tryptophanyl-tRNA synthetase
MQTSEIKQILADTLWAMVKQHQQARAAVTDDVVKQFMAVRPLDCSLPRLPGKPKA